MNQDLYNEYYNLVHPLSDKEIEYIKVNKPWLFEKINEALDIYHFAEASMFIHVFRLNNKI